MQVEIQLSCIEKARNDKDSIEIINHNVRKNLHDKYDEIKIRC